MLLTINLQTMLQHPISMPSIEMKLLWSIDMCNVKTYVDACFELYKHYKISNKIQDLKLLVET